MRVGRVPRGRVDSAYMLTVAELTALLKEILMEEHELDCLGDLDVDRNEPESFMWLILQDADFAPDKDRHMAWRLTARELQKRAEAAVEAEPAPKRRR